MNRNTCPYCGTIQLEDASEIFPTLCDYRKRKLDTEIEEIKSQLHAAKLKSKSVARAWTRLWKKRERSFKKRLAKMKKSIHKKKYFIVLEQ